MALREQRVAVFGDYVAFVGFEFDDVSMLVVRVFASNIHPTKTLRIDVTSPRTLTRNVGPHEAFEISLPGGQQIPYEITPDYHGNDRWSGIVWSATLGL